MYVSANARHRMALVRASNPIAETTTSKNMRANSPDEQTVLQYSTILGCSGYARCRSQLRSSRLAHIDQARLATSTALASRDVSDASPYFVLVHSTSLSRAITSAYSLTSQYLEYGRASGHLTLETFYRYPP
jgi:hypothetical protein